MDELELLRQKALALINDPQQSPEALLQGSELLKRAEEIESARLSVCKLKEELSARHVIEMIKLLAPYATVLILAATLAFQVWQLREAEKDRSIERQDALWADALQSESKDQLAAMIKLKNFAAPEKPHYEDAAQLVVSILRHSEDPGRFKELFESRFSEVTAANLDLVLRINRALHWEWVDLNSQVQLDSTRTQSNDPQKQQIVAELTYTCTKIAPVLKTRPSDQGFDLHDVALFDCDLSYADLRDANLRGFVTARVNLKNANLCGAHISTDGYWNDTMWWDAASISPDSLHYLSQYARLTLPPDHYRPYPRNDAKWSPPTQQLYDDALRRLSSAQANCQ